MEDIENHAQKIWDYMKIDDDLKKADAIIMFGSHDPQVARYATKLYLNGWAPLLVFSGARGKGTEHWKETEAKTYSSIAKDMGVPENAILIEDKSTNTAENINFTKQVLKKNRLKPKRVIIVQKSYMGRRVLATMQKIWSDIEYIITSPPIHFGEYEIPGLTRQEMIGSMTGDLERLKLYAEQGFSVQQNIPNEIWEARNKIREAGIMRRYVKV